MPDWLQPLQPNHRPPGRTPAPVGEGPLSFERAVERFAESHVSRKTGRLFSSTSRQNIRNNLLGGPLTAFRRERSVETVAAWNGDLAADYLQWLQVDLRRASATIKKVRGQLRSFGAFCDEHFGTKNAAGGALTALRVSPATDYHRRRDPALTQGEAEHLLKAALTGRDRLIVAMLLYTGMRPSELLALDEQHIRLDRTPPVVEIRGTVHDPDATKTQAGFRDVPLTVGQSAVPRLLRAHLSDPARPVGASRLFLSLRKDHYGRAQPLTMEGLKSMLATLGEATGIKCNAYRFRHTFCTWCADAGMHMLHLQQLLGHASSDMVAYYYRGKTSEAVLQVAARVRF
jgi:integrase